MGRNVELTPQLESLKIEQPSLFIVGTKDPVLSFGKHLSDLRQKPPPRSNSVEQMDNWVTDMRGKVFIDGAGHWLQMEQPLAVNEALISFLKTVT